MPFPLEFAHEHLFPRRRERGHLGDHLRRHLYHRGGSCRHLIFAEPQEPIVIHRTRGVNKRWRSVFEPLAAVRRSSPAGQSIRAFARWRERFQSVPELVDRHKRCAGAADRPSGCLVNRHAQYLTEYDQVRAPGFPPDNQ